MSNNIYLLTNTIDDVVFEHRNQQYGAYWLRTHYHKHMAKGLFVAFISVSMIFSLPNILAYFVDPVVIEEICDEYYQIDLAQYRPPTPVKPIEQPKTSILPLFDMVKNVEPIIVTDNKLINEELPIKNDNLFGKVIGTENITGNTIGSPMGQDDGIKNGTHIHLLAAKDTSQLVSSVIEVDERPMFPKGEVELFKYLSQNIKYPSLARETGIEGKVVLTFVISKTGEIEDIKVARGIGGGCDEEAVRVVKRMPAWSPGKIKGRPVKVKFTLPIWYRLSN